MFEWLKEKFLSNDKVQELTDTASETATEKGEGLIDKATSWMEDL